MRSSLPPSPATLDPRVKPEDDGGGGEHRPAPLEVFRAARAVVLSMLLRLARCLRSWATTTPCGIPSSSLPLVFLRFDDFSHRDAELVVDHDDFAARDEAVVEVDVHGFTDFAVELDDGA